MAEKLEVEPLSEVFQIVRLRLADDEPLMYETSYLPKRHFPRLTKKDIVERPMYDVFLEDYDMTVTSATERFTATTVRQAEADYLHVKPDDVGMLIDRKSTRLNSSHVARSYAVFCLKQKR